jgi:hypothetical protein
MRWIPSLAIVTVGSSRGAITILSLSGPWSVVTSGFGRVSISAAPMPRRFSLPSLSLFSNRKNKATQPDARNKFGGYTQSFAFDITTGTDVVLKPRSLSPSGAMPGKNCRNHKIISWLVLSAGTAAAGSRSEWVAFDTRHRIPLTLPSPSSNQLEDVPEEEEDIADATASPSGAMMVRYLNGIPRFRNWGPIHT